MTFDEWWLHRRRSASFRVTRIPFERLDGWLFDSENGNLRHASGRFFAVKGMNVHGPGGGPWTAPVIHQPEVGILGILLREIDGEPHCLMQAKFEPGNVNGLQLSPTVQATRSNYTRVHKGKPVPFLDCFLRPRGQVVADTLQSEQGAWFWRKYNRNMVVRIAGDVPRRKEFHWVPLRLLFRMLHSENLVNMDSRSVLSTLPVPRERPRPEAVTAGQWLAAARHRCGWRSSLIPLAQARVTRSELEVTGPGARVIAVQAEAGDREVTRWTQPLLAPDSPALAAFLLRRVEGVRQVLVRARPEPGLRRLVEIGPTVQSAPAQGGVNDPYLAAVLAARPRFDAILSEEGGRFWHARTRYLIAEAGEDLSGRPPPDFRWLTPGQLSELVRSGGLVNVQARTLLACLLSLSGDDHESS
ncbi:NDP-hexose 2,3-dehydratase [Actinomadura sp. KC06]|uniref:NDP-hexose 2,3-dehydratase family protein n=1 Tax=Actinomadura sp. KC06 TaxID=2530369 RepID=UPI0010533A72|nr:NDP-hexose 2,3-dehydratase family protein [Actinomadura sp. KC06]TDD37573.1 NDP-hexose 2,3-dehydratase [Actinomadura sp. KC06]